MKRIHTSACFVAGPCRAALSFALGSRALQLSLVLTPLSLTLPNSAAAQQEDAKALARQHFQRGVELANQSAYGESLLEFSQAYQLSPHYSVLYNIGQAHVALAHSVLAVEALKRYLSEGGANIALERRKEVEAEVIRQFARTAPLEVRVDTARALVTIDGEPRGRTPLAGPVRLDLGSHQVTVALDSGERSERTINLTSPENQVAEFQLRAPPPVPDAPRSPLAAQGLPATFPPSDARAAENHGRTTLGLVIGAVGVGLGGASLAHFLWNRGRYRDWQAKYAHYSAEPTAASREDANQLAESIPRASAVTIALAIGGGLALGSGTLLLLTDSGNAKAVGSVASWRGVW